VSGLKVRKIPLRMCTGCTEMKPKKELVRVVKNKEGVVSMDLTGKKTWKRSICLQEYCLFRKSL
jgi:predicted RNA-binding protein YlxR (DUF448 family)